MIKRIIATLPKTAPRNDDFKFKRRMSFDEWWKSTGYGWEDAHGIQTSPREIAQKAWNASKENK
jgi:hypothetical protein